ncbi:MAG: relaxase/mobilization nuclease domain-containing protein [Lachnospiraceae bacterium]|nr:relaxase/mobilization nuclease domain-containing protein [Lachnospiraceae bacterium]
MAVTKIHAIKATVNKAIDYICNPEKTDEKIYISSFACAPETATLDFKYTLDHTTEQSFVNGEDRENKAFHLIQAFQPGEVSYEEAHAIGKELADQVLEGKYSYVLTTHIDKGHVHNHLIFCAADNMNFKHYHDCKQTYRRIRNISDKLCKEHGLSVISENQNRGMKYKEWQATNTESSWKMQLRKDINQTIKTASTYNDFLAIMRTKGYEIKNDSLDGTDGKYITFLPIGRERVIRGSVKSLGKNFTKERIAERIENKRNRTFIFTKSDRKIQKLIDTASDSKFAESIGLQRWATKENLKIAAQTFNQMTAKGIHNFTELGNKICSLQEQTKSANSSIVSIEHQMRELAEIIKYAQQYKENKSFYDRYERVKDKDRFLRKYESKIILFSGAERMLQQQGIDPGHMNLEKLQTNYQKLLEKKKELTATHKSAQAEIKELELIRNNMEQYINIASEVEHSRENPLSRDIQK